MRLIGRKFVNRTGNSVKVSCIKSAEDGREFVYYVDPNIEWGKSKHVMKLPKLTFINKYKKSLDEFKKAK